MDSIFDRLGRVVRSYLNDTDTDTNGRSYTGDDPDLADAWAELDDFLNDDFDAAPRTGDRGFRRSVPNELRADFELLNVSSDADFATVKQAYKKLMMAYHPDKHSGDPQALHDATEMAKKVNAAFQRVKKWYEEEGL